MAQEILIKADKRPDSGSSAVKGLRREGILPGIVYGSGKEAEMIQINEHEFEQLLRHHASEHLIVSLEIGDAASKKVLLKDVQHHPVTQRILHVDFHEISMKQKLRLQIPVEFIGEPEGVVQQGGVLEHLLREIEVECLPTDIPEVIEVDVSKLMIGDSLSVENIDLDSSKFTIITTPDVAIAAVAAPRVEEEPAESDEELAEGEADGGEPEVIGEKKDEEAGEQKSGD